MLLHLVFILSCAIYASAQEQTLAARLSYQPVCFYQAMIDSFNATNMNGRLDGSGGPYMLFAICDPVSGNLPSYTVDQLNYHLGLGELGYNELPEDGLIPTALVDNFIRITHYAGVPFANGERKLGNASLSDYYGPAEVVKGSFYRLDSNIVTGKFGPMTPPDKRTILEVIQDDTLFPTASLVSAMFVPLAPPFDPPSTTSWTFLAPVDAVFDTIPKYQREFLLSGVGTYSLLYNHVINGTHFVAPLAKISSERTGTSQATYDYLTTETGHNLTMRYAYQTKVFYVENKLLVTNKTDYHCSDGVIHLINDFLFFEDISKSLPPPTPAEFVEQYGLPTFSLPLKQSLGFDPTVQLTAVSKYIDLIKNSGVKIPDVEVTLFMIWDTALSTLGTTSLSERLVNYLILPGQYRLADLPHDTLIDTFYAPQSLRISVFDDGATYYINGFATIIKSDLLLNKATIHIIDTPFLLAPPCQPGDLVCENEEGWINSTIAESIKGIADCSIWVGLLEKAGYSISAPYTLFLIPDAVFGVFGENGPALKDYLNADATFLQEYVKKFYLDGTLYPNIAKESDWNVAAKDGTTYKFTTVSGSKKIFINDLYQGDAYIRNDGIFYVITLTNAGDLFPFDLPETPVEPSPAPVAPPGEIPDPVKPDNSALRMNGIQIWFYLFFALAILFLI